MKLARLFSESFMKEVVFELGPEKYVNVDIKNSSGSRTTMSKLLQIGKIYMYMRQSIYGYQ